MDFIITVDYNFLKKVTIMNDGEIGE